MMPFFQLEFRLSKAVLIIMVVLNSLSLSSIVNLLCILEKIQVVLELWVKFSMIDCLAKVEAIITSWDGLFGPQLGQSPDRA